MEARLTLKPPAPGMMPAGIVSFSVALVIVSPYAATLSSRAGAVTGSVASNASVSPPSVTVIWTRAWPRAVAIASKRTGTDSPGASRTVRVSSPANCSDGRSRLRIVTTASPALPVPLVTTAPKEARSPCPMKRGKAASIVSGFVARISLSAAPKCDERSPATAMTR